MGRAKGFTLIELMVTIAIVATLGMIAAPSLIKIRQNGELADASNSLLMAANAAKAASLKTGLNSYVIAHNGTSTSTSWGDGWLVYTDNNWNGVFNEGVDTIVMRRGSLPTGIVTSTPTASSPMAAGFIRFDGSGFPKSLTGGAGNGTVVMALPHRSTSVVINVAGRIRSCTTGATGCNDS